MIRYISLVVLFFSIIGSAQTQKDLDKLQELAQKDKNSEVINESTRLIKLYPKGADVYYCYFQRGTAYLESENYYKAEPDLKKCVELNPTWAPGLNNLYIVYAQTEEYGKAIPLLKKLIDIRDNPVDHYEIGKAYLETNDFQNSIEAFNNYLNMGDDNISIKRLAVYNRGVAKNSIKKGSGCEDVYNALTNAYIEYKSYPFSLVKFDYKSLDYACENRCMTYSYAKKIFKAMQKANKIIYKKF